jgi:hypothetical protein
MEVVMRCSGAVTFYVYRILFVHYCVVEGELPDLRLHSLLLDTFPGKLLTHFYLSLHFDVVVTFSVGYIVPDPTGPAEELMCLFLPLLFVVITFPLLAVGIVVTVFHFVVLGSLCLCGSNAAVVCCWDILHWVCCISLEVAFSGGGSTMGCLFCYLSLI